ncbi:MAG: beta-lactamase family protein [Clostridia bacterium]|nr:beta-lactamase family protein [Clostridia bacterium]
MDMQYLLDSLLQKGLQQGAYPGAVAACGDREHVYALSCIGKIAENGPEVTKETRYDMASLSKILGTTMVAFKALEAGDLSLYDPITRFFEDVPEDKKSINIFHLMTHTSGLKAEIRLDRLLDSPDQALRALLDSELDHKPGETPVYSCMGYITLGFALESLYGKPLKELAREMVFEPLGMHHTCYCPTGDNIAATEVDPVTGKAWVGVVHDENARFLGGNSGNAGVFSDISDMIIFAQMLSRMGDGFLSPALMKTAIRCHAASADGEVRRGLGFHLSGTPMCYMGELMPPTSFGHTGFTGTCLAIDPDTGFWAVLLSNRVHPTRESTALFAFRRRMHNALYAEYTKG